MMLFSLLWGCGSPPLPDGELSIPDATPVDLVDSEGAAGRPRRRMNIDQLALAIEDVTGHAWQDGSDPLFVALSGTLGKPEFLDSTEEDLDPGLLFQKFLDDAAKQTCRRLVTDELDRSESERIFIRPANPGTPPADDLERTRETLSRALLRFHGRTLAADHPDLDRWQWLVTTVDDRAGTRAAWRAVCIGLITHPDFSSY